MTSKKSWVKHITFNSIKRTHLSIPSVGHQILGACRKLAQEPLSEVRNIGMFISPRCICSELQLFYYYSYSISTARYDSTHLWDVSTQSTLNPETQNMKVESRTEIFFYLQYKQGIKDTQISRNCREMKRVWQTRGHLSSLSQFLHKEFSCNRGLGM